MTKQRYNFGAMRMDYDVHLRLETTARNSLHPQLARWASDIKRLFDLRNFDLPEKIIGAISSEVV